MALPHFSSNDLRLGDYASIGGFKMQGATVEDFAGFNFGWADINGDGLSDLLVSADGYDGGGLLAGGAFVIYGKQDGIASFIDFADLSPSDGFVIQGEFASDLAGRMLSGAGDVNGDGIEDMFIGAFKNDEAAYDSGAAYIIYGRAEPFAPVLDLYDLPADVGIKILGEGEEDYASFWVASAGDVNGDGRNDLIMGAPLNDGGGANSGAAYVIFGRDSNYLGAINLATLAPEVGFKISGATAGDLAGYGVSSAGDINGDGIADLIIGAPQDGLTGAGRAYVLYGRQDIGAIDLAELTESQGFAISGEANGDMAGFNVAGAGDINGDGIDDIVIGATLQDSGGSNAGAAYVIFGKNGGMGGSFDLTALDGTNGFKLEGAAAGDETGVCVATAGDVNGDGYDDLLVGAQFSSITGTISGAAYLLFGKPGGFAPVLDLGNLSPRDGILFRGESSGDTTGRAVSAAGDMNGDGYDDIAIGSPWNNAAGFKAGAAYVIYGRPDNRAPEAIDSRVTGAEDVSYVFNLADFGFVDGDGDDLLEVLIASVPTRGILMLRGEGGTLDRALSAGETVSVASINADRLYFAAEADASGSDYASFTFGVRDSGGIVGNGQDSSTATATMTIAVTADPSDRDLVYGTNGDDTLVGNGGNVSLIGLAGDDLYLINNAGQVAIEAAGDGYDIVRTSVDYTLASDSEVERLEAIDPTGTDFLRLTGNEYDNYLRGNNGANSLYGAGGNNVLEGLGGDDSYLVSSPNDQIIEGANGGNDTVYVLGDYVLTAGAHVETLLAYDRALTTAQNLTGNELNNLILGSRGNNVINGGGGTDIMYGYRGDDIFYVDSADDLPVEFFGEGHDIIVTTVSYTIPQGMEFEVLRTIDPSATTAIHLTGNKIPNMLIGNAGANTIDGAGGGDTMQGLEGDDIYVVRHANDLVLEMAGGGYDTVRTLIDYAAGNANIERIEAFDIASTNALRLTGNALDNVMIGNAGANLFTGGAGSDLLYGLGGDDAYIITDSRARVFEALGGGRDTVYVTTDFSLDTGAEVEVLSVYDRATSNTVRLIGNEFANLIYGNDGNNLLSGGGGADILYGLGGDDAYLVSDTRARVIEFAGGGYDTVYVTTNFALESGAAVEVLTVYERETANAINLTGNETANLIYGNAGANIIDGGGGGDIMQGLGGDDTYIVRHASDRVIETADGGYDTVRTTMDFSIGNASIERVEAFDPNSTDALRLTGNALDNMMIGNAGANLFTGGAGADLLYGLGGNDAYIVDDSRAQVFEAVGNGHDTVYVTANFALTSGSEIEVLSVYDRSTTNALDLTGNEFSNAIYGNGGSNRIDGGLGNDILYGNGGADTFVFGSALGADNVDQLTDFQSGTDRLELDHRIFGGIATGVLATSAFVLGTQAVDADDRIIYNAATGALYYDADGVGGTAAVQFAVLNPSASLTAGDFLIV